MGVYGNKMFALFRSLIFIKKSTIKSFNGRNTSFSGYSPFNVYSALSVVGGKESDSAANSIYENNLHIIT